MDNKKNIVWIDRVKSVLQLAYENLPNRKYIYLLFYSLLILVVSFSIYFYLEYKKNLDIRSIYYGVMSDFSKKMGGMRENFIKPTDDEIVIILDKYKKIININSSGAETYFAHFNMGIIYYMIGNYDQAVISFEKSIYGIPFKYQARLNMAHSFLNMGYDSYREILKNQSKKKTDISKEIKIIYNNYLSALSLYKKVKKQGPVKNLTYLNFYIGLAYENIGDLYSLKGDNKYLEYYDKAIETYTKNKNNFYLVSLKGKLNLISR